MRKEMVFLVVTLLVAVAPVLSGSPEFAKVLSGEGGVFEQLQEGGDLNWMMQLDKKSSVGDIQYVGPENFSLNSQFEFKGEIPADKNLCAVFVAYDYGLVGEEVKKGWEVCNSFVSEVNDGVAIPKPLMTGPWYTAEWLIKNSRPDTMYLILISYEVRGGQVYVDLYGGPWTLQYLGPNAVAGVEDLNSAPMEFSLGQNYPNPFNGTTTISFQLERPSEISLKVFNMLGREVAGLVKGKYSAGFYSVQWNGVSQPTGVYILRFQAGQRFVTRKMVLQK